MIYKKMTLALFIYLISSTFSAADTCPLPDQFTPRLPPAGWTLLMPAIFPGDKYHFVSATHSLNSTYYHLQVICRYECSPDTKNCSPFALVSNSIYQQPTTNTAPWNITPTIVYTLVCNPPDHNPIQCIFSNIPKNDSIVLNEITPFGRLSPQSTLSTLLTTKIC